MQTPNAQENQCSQQCKGYGTYKKFDMPKEDISEISQKASTAQSKPNEPARPGEVPPSSRHRKETDYYPKLNKGPDGNVDFTNLPKFSGIRPEVNKYSLNRFSLNEWKKHNEDVLSPDVINKSNGVDYYVQSAIATAFGTVDKKQIDSKNKLKRNARELHRWKEEVKRACDEITKEVNLLEVERQRLKGASRTLMLPESISKECLELRHQRSQRDLVADVVEIELKKELELIAEVRENLSRTLNKIEEQLVIDKKAKQTVEYDWSDKNAAYDTECINLGLDSRSNNILFKLGSTRYSDFSAPLEFWEHHCREIIDNVEAVRQHSMDVRGGINAVLINGGRKLRLQADRTDMAFAENVAMTQELCGKLELTLKSTLQRIADMEKLIEKLNESIRKMDGAMKLAQTRLDNRNNFRGKNECVRDEAHVGLINEVKTIHEVVTSLVTQLKNTKKVREELMEKRIELEKNIAAKRMTLTIDRERCGMVRAHYPSASELAGL